MRRAFVLVLLLPACSVASGWSDLQGGTKTTTPSSKDAGGTPVDDAGGPQSKAIRCGTAECTGDLICCYLGSRSCSPAATCEANQGIPMSCTEKSNCGAGEVCCLDSSALTASCKKSEACAITDGYETLCIPDRADDCFPGQTCQSSSGLQTCR
jgi:hypothetical protein